MRKWIIYILLLFIVGTLHLQQVNYNRLESTIHNIDIIVQSISKSIEIKLDEFKSSLEPDFTKMKQSTVQIKVGKYGGAGIIAKIDDKYLYIITAKHIAIIKGKVSICIKDIKGRVSILEGISRDNIYIDDIIDMALIKLPKPEGEYASFSFAKKEPYIGEKIYTIGHPIKTFFSINEGIVSNYTKKCYMKKKGEYMLISAPSFSGNSGGVVVNRRTELVGMVVGIVYLKDRRTTYYLYYMTFAVRLNDIKRLLEERK